MFTKHSQSHSCNASVATFFMSWFLLCFLFKCICLEGKWENTSRIVYMQRHSFHHQMFSFSLLCCPSIYWWKKQNCTYVKLRTIQNEQKERKKVLLDFCTCIKEPRKADAYEFTCIYTIFFTSLFLCSSTFINADTRWTYITMRHPSRCLEVLTPSFHSNLRNCVLLSPLLQVRRLRPRKINRLTAQQGFI